MAWRGGLLAHAPGSRSASTSTGSHIPPTTSASKSRMAAWSDRYWTLARGDQVRIVRAVFVAPARQPAVGDLEIGGKKIEFGGQIVKAGPGMMVELTGIVGKPGVLSQPELPVSRSRTRGACS